MNPSRSTASTDSGDTKTASASSEKPSNDMPTSAASKPVANASISEPVSSERTDKKAETRPVSETSATATPSKAPAKTTRKMVFDPEQLPLCFMCQLRHDLGACKLSV